MTLTDIRRHILESTNNEWLNNIEVIFDFDYVQDRFTLKGLSTVYEFVLKQINGWEKLGNNLPEELSKSKLYFEVIKNQIDYFVSNVINSEPNQLINQWSNVYQHINNKSNFPLKYNSPEVEFLLKIYQDYPGSLSSAFSFIIGSVNVNSKQNLIGTILAYEFYLKDASQIVKRSKAEKSALKTVKAELESYFSEAEIDLSKHLKMINDKYSEYVTKIDDLKTLSEKEFNDWFSGSKESFSKFNKDSTDNVKILETTYEEILSLKKPAEYWKLRTSELKADGWKSLYWLIGLVGLACVTLYSLLWLTPDIMLTSFFDNDKSAAVRWSIIFITLISFLFFAIKALSKITFSSFHLARDAEERERLTYVYLAMIKDSSIDKEDRHLIMQSLFSRADTGLLKDDSSPTMPGSIIEKFAK